MPKPSLKVTGIAVIFTVKSLERTLRFYAETLGLPLEAHEGMLSCKLTSGTELVFFEGEAVTGTSPQIVFGLDDGGIDTVVDVLTAHGVQLLTPVSEAPGGWSLEFRDPDGHGLAYFQAGELPRRL